MLILYSIIYDIWYNIFRGLHQQNIIKIPNSFPSAVLITSFSRGKGGMMALFSPSSNISKVASSSPASSVPRRIWNHSSPLGKYSACWEKVGFDFILNPCFLNEIIVILENHFEPLSFSLSLHEKRGVEEKRETQNDYLKLIHLFKTLGVCYM